MLLDRPDADERDVERVCHGPVHQSGIVALDEQRLVAEPAEEIADLVVAHPAEHGRIGNLVAVEMQDRQHRAVMRRIEEFVGVPGRGERAGLGLAVTDDTGDDQVGIVEGRAIGMHQRVTELTAFVDRARRFRRRVARDAAGEGELPEQLAQPGGIARDVGIELAVAAFEIGVGDHAGAAVPGTADIDHVQVQRADDAVEMGINEVQTGRRAPMAEQTRLDVLGP